MKFKLMVVDDDLERKSAYEAVLSDEIFETIFVWSKEDFEKFKETPVDGYLLDVFLDKEGWRDKQKGTDAAEMVNMHLRSAPRPAPVFLVSQEWGDEKILDVLKQIGDSSVTVVQYFAWSEFQAVLSEEGDNQYRLRALRKKIESEIVRWHGRSRFMPAPDDSIRILLIADPQFGDPQTADTATYAENWIALTLKEWEKKSPEERVPDLIVIAGDISYSGRPAEFAFAEDRLIYDLIGPLWGKNNIDRMKDRLIIVPGNHDVNLRFSAADKYDFSLEEKNFSESKLPLISNDDGNPYPSHRDYGLAPFRNFAHKMTGQREWLESKTLSWVDRRFIHCGIQFFVLNTVAELDAESPARATIRESHVRQINRSILDGQPEGIFTIAVSHHGLAPRNQSKKEAGIENWVETGRELFSLNKVKLWMFGHYHQFDAPPEASDPFHESPLWTIQIPTTRIYCEERGFCVLDLKRKGGVVIDARVRSYALKNGKSTRSESDRGVFGNLAR
ncbi:hypothetical protein E6Q11_03395 [Candidatus Dojkabacteria bacterium]|uniref:Calcineurin-like phosphoesterase domain-containing protein n=1 Tax=Candidatus Dojkabacteria bacterium TaxID=2099670 RepID=A0A5C7J6K3_9BACT|nr:MAG: hypothetical protein E6Q11_03395 [Candidatus Dojkabacteria bacterium]